MTDERDGEQQFEAWLRRDGGAPPIPPERAARVMDAVMARLDAPAPGFLASLRGRLGMICSGGCFETSLRFGLPMAVGLLLGVFVGGALEPARPAVLLPHLTTPTLGLGGGW